MLFMFLCACVCVRKDLIMFLLSVVTEVGRFLTVSRRRCLGGGIRDYQYKTLHPTPDVPVPVLSCPRYGYVALFLMCVCVKHRNVTPSRYGNSVVL